MAKTSSILDRLILLLTPLRLAGEHEGYLRNLAAAVGWDIDEVVGFDAAPEGRLLGCHGPGW